MNSFKNILIFIELWEHGTPFPFQFVRQQLHVNSFKALVKKFFFYGLVHSLSVFIVIIFTTTTV